MRPLRARSIFFVTSLALAGLGCGPSSSESSQAKPNRQAEPASEPAAADQTGDAVPVIASDEPEFDFGTVSPTGSVTHVFKLVNRGTADLKIERVERTWGCTASVISADVLPPGGEGEVKVTLTPKGNHEDILKRITVLSNDPKQPRFTLTMKGKLLVDLRAEPASLNLPEIKPGEPATLAFSLKISDPGTTRVESVELEDQENFSVRALPVETEGELPYELRFRGSKTVGSFGSRVRVKTTGKHTPSLDIPIRAAVVSNLRYSKRLHFPKRDEEFAARPIRFSTRDGTTPKLAKIEDPDGLLIVEIRDPSDGSVTVDAQVDVGKFEALAEAERSKPRKLIVHTNDPHEPKVEIGYTIGAAVTPARARAGR